MVMANYRANGDTIGPAASGWDYGLEWDGTGDCPHSDEIDWKPWVVHDFQGHPIFSSRLGKSLKYGVRVIQFQRAEEMDETQIDFSGVHWVDNSTGHCFDWINHITLGPGLYTAYIIQWDELKQMCHPEWEIPHYSAVAITKRLIELWGLIRSDGTTVSPQ
jgi:hypothetical protein